MPPGVPGDFTVGDGLSRAYTIGRNERPECKESHSERHSNTVAQSLYHSLSMNGSQLRLPSHASR